jgi:sirohydrochlorin ferrochelatase
MTEKIVADRVDNSHLLLIAHGSRREASNREVVAVVERLRGMQSGRFSSIEAAFLELAEPSIEEGLEVLAGRGAQHIVVMPYFLAAGSHVIQDIPEILEKFRWRHPGISLCLKEHVGRSEGMSRLILDFVDS